MGIEGKKASLSSQNNHIELPRAVWELKVCEIVRKQKIIQLNSHAQYGN